MCACSSALGSALQKGSQERRSASLTTPAWRSPGASSTAGMGNTRRGRVCVVKESKKTRRHLSSKSRAQSATHGMPSASRCPDERRSCLATRAALDSRQRRNVSSWFNRSCVSFVRAAGSAKGVIVSRVFWRRRRGSQRARRAGRRDGEGKEEIVPRNIPLFLDLLLILQSCGWWRGRRER